MTDYTIVRSRRRTAVIEITEDLRLIARVPYSMRDAEVRKLVRENRPAIDRRIAKIRERLEKQRAVFGTEEAFTEEEVRQLAEEARREIPQRVRYFAGIMGVRYGTVTIRNQVTRWGSCSVRGNLSFNCLIMRCPADVRDYVIVHELAHLKEMNHSPRFWAEVQAVLPDYRARKEWLRENGGGLIRRMREWKEKQ